MPDQQTRHRQPRAGQWERCKQLLRRNKVRHWASAAVVFVAVALAVETGVRLYKQSAAADAYTAAVDFAGQLLTRAEAELNSIIYLSSGLSAYLRVNADELDGDEIRQILGELFRNTRHTQNFGVARGYEIRYIYPRAGNQAVLGLDYRDLPDQIADVQAAIDARMPVLSGRVELVQGGSGLVYRAPIFVDGAYWGLLSTVIDLDSLLDDAFGASALMLRAFAVRDADGAMLWGEPAVFSSAANPRLQGNNGWTYAVVPEADPQDATAIIVFRVLGYGLAIALALIVFAGLEHRVSLLRLSREDVLTRLVNRRVLDEHVALRLAQLGRDRQAGFALIFIDLDRFKPINDTYGHRGGDAVLATVGRRLAAAVRSTDVAARWGGDEFAVFAPETRSTHLSVLIDRLGAIFDEPVPFQGKQIEISGSIGHAVAPTDGASEADLAAVADERMYSAKASARRQS